MRRRMVLAGTTRSPTEACRGVVRMGSRTPSSSVWLVPPSVLAGDPNMKTFATSTDGRRHGHGDDHGYGHGHGHVHGHRHYDVLIIGGGVVGSALARGLSRLPRPPSIGVVDGGKSGSGVWDGSKLTTTPPSARAYALSPASLEFLGDDVVGRIAAWNRVAPYDRMQIWESDGPSTLHFTETDLRPRTKPKNPLQSKKEERSVGRLGAVIEDAPLVASLWESLRGCDCVDRMGSAHMESVRRTSDHGGWTVTVRRPNDQGHDDHNHNHDEAGIETVTTDLLVGADGAHSSVRTALKIPFDRSPYGRRAVTCTVRTSAPLNRTAFQRFVSERGGPIALLPVGGEHANHDDEGVVHYANIVWSTTPEYAAMLESMTEEEFVNTLNRALRVGPVPFPPLTGRGNGVWDTLEHEADRLVRAVAEGLTLARWQEGGPGARFDLPPAIEHVVGPRFGFDLVRGQAQSYVHANAVLVGDAAHTLHPMAGQGLNLGLGDARCLTETVAEATACGMDPSTFLASHYDRPRRIASGFAMGGVGVLDWAFDQSQRHPALSRLRSVGMNVVGALPPVRSRLVDLATTGGGIL